MHLSDTSVQAAEHGHWGMLAGGGCIPASKSGSRTSELITKMWHKTVSEGCDHFLDNTGFPSSRLAHSTRP